MKEKLLKFRPYMPVIRALCNPGLMDRHRIRIGCAIYGETGKNDSNGDPIPHKNFEPGDSTVDDLGKFICDTKGAIDPSKRDMIEEISDKASKEFGNMKTMDKMREEWGPLEFTCNQCEGKDFKGAPQYIISGEAVENIQTALDDHVIKTQTMKGSPFAKFMLDEITKWEANLLRTQDNLDIWLKVQATWMYLEPVFSAEDIIN